MSGESVFYHLRPNKAVDRNLFAELLSCLNGYKTISNHRYVGMGNVFFEDFKIIHRLFDIKRMISLEIDQNVVQRQKFNRPYSCIEVLNESAREFIDRDEENKSTIFWFDYSEATAQRTQINDLAVLIAKRAIYGMDGDVFRITLNANPKAIYVPRDRNEDRDTVDEERLSRWSDQLEDMITLSPLTVNNISPKNFPTILINAIETSVHRQLHSNGMNSYSLIPLAAYAYNDKEHQMLTFTGVLLQDSNIRDFWAKTNLKKWRHIIKRKNNTLQYKSIHVPALTAKEKLCADSMIKHNSRAKSICKGINFSTSRPTEGIELIESYIEYYRHYPNFHQVLF